MEVCVFICRVVMSNSNLDRGKGRRMLSWYCCMGRVGRLDDHQPGRVLDDQKSLGPGKVGGAAPKTLVLV